MKTLNIGDIRVDRVVESELPIFEPDFLFPDASHEALDPDREWLGTAFCGP